MELVTLGVEVKTTGSQQAAQQLGQFSTAAKGAAGSADALEDQIRSLGAAQTQAANASRPLSGALQGVGQAFSRNSSAIQNASFQLQDIVVQMSMGVPAARTLGMQLPQLLGGFGPLGAVIGLAVGALLAFAPAAFGAADSAQALEDALGALDDAMQRVHAAQKGQSFSDLAAQYGEQASAARDLLAIQRQIAEVEAERAFKAASVEVVGALGPGLQSQSAKSATDYERALTIALREQAAVRQIEQDIALRGLTLDIEQTNELGRRRRAYEHLLASIAPYRQGIEQLAEEFGITEQAAAGLAVKLAAVTDADTTEERVAAAQALAHAIDEATGGLGESSDQGLKLYDALLKASLAGLDLQQIDLAAGLSAAASEAARIADELGRAATNAMSAASNAAAARQDAAIRQQFVGDPVGQAGALAAAQFDRSAGALAGSQDAILRGLFTSTKAEVVANAEATATLNAETAKLTETMRGGAVATSDAASKAARLYESTRTDAEQYAAGLEELRTLYQSGAIDSDLYSRALEDLNQKFDPLHQVIKDVAGTIESELNSAFSSVLHGTATLSQALLNFASNVLAKVAEDLFAKQFAAPISSGLSGWLGGLFSANGNVFDSSGVTAFARGGVVSGPTVFPFANGVGLMGEAGPEAIMPLSRGADGKLGVVANSNNAPTVTINNYSGQEASASTDSAGNITVEIGRAVAQDITSGGPAYRAIRSTFGLSNRLQQRG